MAVSMLWILFSIFGLSATTDVQLNVNKLLQRIETLEQNQHRLEEIIKTQHNSNQKRLKVNSPSIVAFSAYINHFINTLAVNEIIPFEVVTTNEGNAFDGKTGIFTCSTPGLYLFVWNIMVDSGHGTQAKLMVNGVVRRWSNAYSTGHYANAANHDIVRLEEGDRVWLADGYASGEIHPHHTTFSGVLFHE